MPDQPPIQTQPAPVPATEQANSVPPPEPVRPKSKKWVIWTTLSIVALLLLGWGIWGIGDLIKNTFNKNNSGANFLAQTSSPDPMTTLGLPLSEFSEKVLAELPDILNTIYQKYKNTHDLSFKPNSDIYWIDTDGLYVFSSGPAIVFNTDDILDNELVSDIRNIFLQNGYIFNQTNSVETLYDGGDTIDDSFFGTYAESFEKDTIKCTLDIREGTRIVCTENLKGGNYAEQKFFLDLFKSDLDHGFIASIEQIDDFASLEISWGTTEAWFLAHKSGDNWEKIFFGHGGLDCNVVKNYKIPKSVIWACYDDKGNEIENNFY